ncbi:hypothetical protein AB0M40_34795 [Streptomyces hydrogenans]
MAVEAAESRHTAVAGERAIARMVQTLVGELASLNEEVAEVEGRIESRFREHDRAEIIESVPGIGAVLGAESSPPLTEVSTPSPPLTGSQRWRG